jgi:hypothetical protein
MSASVNADEFGRIANEWADKTVTREFNTRLRKISLALFELISGASPVRTGRFRGSWDMEVGSYPGRPGLSEEGTGGNEAMATQAALRRAQAALGMLQGATRIIDFVGVANPMVYGPPLEYGVRTGGSSRSGGDVLRVGSMKSGPGFVRASVEVMRSRIRSGAI